MCPSEISLYAIPIASVAEEQAVDIEKFKPLRLFLIAICPPAIFGIILGT